MTHSKADNETRVLIHLANNPECSVRDFVLIYTRASTVVSHGGYRALRRCCAKRWALEGPSTVYQITEAGRQELRRQGLGGRSLPRTASPTTLARLRAEVERHRAQR